MRRLRLDRRSFLRGAGATLALPLLEAMTPSAGAAEDTGPVRLLWIFVPNGKHMPDWTPREEGTDFPLPFLLEPLAPFREHLSVFSGLGLEAGRAHGDGPGDHARAAATFLTGAHPVKTAGANLRAGVSVDQVAARVLGRATPFPSLEVGCEAGRAAGRCDSGYSCAYVSTISWRTPTTPQPKAVVPRAVFERLFSGRTLSPAARRRGARRRRSILDLVREDARSLAARLGRHDRRKLEEYLTAVREVEARIERAEGRPAVEVPETVPPGVPSDFGEHVDLMQDLLVLAFRCDLTRVATFMVANAGSNRTYRQVGVREGHHTVSHHGGKPEKIAKLRAINRFHTEKLARLVRLLAEAREGEASLLDRSLVLYGSGLSDGQRHDHHELPVLLLGRGAGVAAGVHRRFPRGTPLCNLYLALLQRAGVAARRFGDSTEPLPLGERG
ncbi:MAG: DUF1552 domain-containing protein [Planctomycetota bacterium]|nr:MAG: DUF1552 domain-containing protein [Planctomycetota bacterium]